MSEPTERYLRPVEAAALLYVSAKTVSRWAREGKLNALRTLGNHRRFRLADVEALREQLAATQYDSPKGPQNPVRRPHKTGWGKGNQPMMINETTEITTDGTAVWINAPFCIGRFHPSLLEVAPKQPDLAMQAQLTLRVDSARQMTAWNNFKTLMKTTHGIEVPDSFRPSWVEEDHDIETTQF